MERFGPTRRGGPVFRWLGEPLAIDLANTVMVVREGKSVDLIADSEGVRRWLEAEDDRLGPRDAAIGGADAVRTLRDAVRAVLIASVDGSAPPKRALDVVNAASRAAPIAPQANPDQSGALEASDLAAGGEPLDRLLGTLARSTITLLTGAGSSRLHVCNAPSCGMLFLGARRWCCAACGNRARAARHYRRKHSAAWRVAEYQTTSRSRASQRRAPT